MRIIGRIVPIFVVATAAASAVVVVPAPAQADGTATQSVAVGRQYGDVWRASFRTKGDGSGYVWNTYGSGECSATYDNFDFRQDSLSNGWSNDIAWAQDRVNCDTALYNFGLNGQGHDAAIKYSAPFYGGRWESSASGLYHNCVTGCFGDDLLTWKTTSSEGSLYARNRANAYTLS